MWVLSGTTAGLLSLRFLPAAGRTIKAINGRILRKLMTYGIENYFYQEISPELLGGHGTSGRRAGRTASHRRNRWRYKAQDRGRSAAAVVKSRSEQIETETDIPSVIPAPVEAGERLGSITYTVDGKVVAYYPVFAAENALGEAKLYGVSCSM